MPANAVQRMADAIEEKAALGIDVETPVAVPLLHAIQRHTVLFQADGGRVQARRARAVPQRGAFHQHFQHGMRLRQSLRRSDFVSRRVPQAHAHRAPRRIHGERVDARTPRDHRRDKNAGAAAF